MKSDPIKIGILTTLTGTLGFLGKNIVRAAEIALEDLKQKHERVEFVIEDVGHFTDVGRAMLVFQRMAARDHIQFFIDGMSSTSTLAIAPLLDALEVVAVMPVTGGEDVDRASDYLFRNGPSDILVGKQVATDLIKKFGCKRSALFTDNIEYTRELSRHFKKYYSGAIVVDAVIPPNETDFSSQLLLVKKERADALVMNMGTNISAAYAIKQAREPMGSTFPIFANFFAFGSDLFEIAGNAAEGVYVYDPAYAEEDPRVRTFFKMYRKRYGVDSPIPFHATGTYDAVRMGLEAIRSVGYNGEKIREYLLTHIKQWKGFNGVTTFDELGNSSNGFTLKKIHNQKLIRV